MSSENAALKFDDFTHTRWSMVLRAKSSDDSQSRDALNALCSIYWYPLYAYIRRGCQSPADAEDLTQGYFMNLLRRGYLKYADKDKGKLRAFLLADVKLFLSNERGRANAAKRGGGKVILSFDQAVAEQRYLVEPADHATPDQLYDRAWATTLLNNVMANLSLEYAGRGQAELFAAIQPFIAWNAGGESYAATGQTLGRTENDIKVNVHRMRKRYRALLEKEVAETVSSPEEVANELGMLAAVFQ